MTERKRLKVWGTEILYSFFFFFFILLEKEKEKHIFRLADENEEVEETTRRRSRRCVLRTASFVHELGNGQQVYSRCTPQHLGECCWRAKKFHVHLKVPREKPSNFQPLSSSATTTLSKTHPTKKYVWFEQIRTLHGNGDPWW